MSTKIIKNIAIIGHSGEGKTTLCEAMLFNGGAIDRMGKVVDGTTVSDHDDLEKAKQMSIYASCSNLEWKDTKINLIDLPGYYDFEGERNEGLRAKNLRYERAENVQDLYNRARDVLLDLKKDYHIIILHFFDDI